MSLLGIRSRANLLLFLLRVWTARISLFLMMYMLLQSVFHKSFESSINYGCAVTEYDVPKRIIVSCCYTLENTDY
jgi:hypothetical protein